MLISKKQIVIGLTLGLLAVPAQATEPYRQHTKHLPGLARASADVSGTYKYWKDTENISDFLLRNDQVWKLNSKWQDEPFDEACTVNM